MLCDDNCSHIILSRPKIVVIRARPKLITIELKRKFSLYASATKDAVIANSVNNETQVIILSVFVY